MNQKVISAIHIYILLILSTGFIVHVLSIPLLLTVSKRDAWISVIFSFIPFILWILIVFYIYKRLNTSFFSFLKMKFSIPISIVFGFYFFISAVITLKSTVIWAKTNYTFEIPNLVVVSLFTLICLYASIKGIRTISTVAFLILPFVILFGLVVGLGNIPNKNFELLFPIFENGYKDSLKGLIFSCSGLFEIIYLLFLTPYLKDPLKLKWLLLVGFMLVLLTLGPLVGAITEFGSVEAEKMRNPAYEQWRILSIGHVTRLDFLSIFQWLSGAFVRISLSLFIADNLFFRQKKTGWVLPILSLLLIIALCIPWNATSFFYFLKNIFYPISLLFQICSLLLFLLLIHLKGDRNAE
jgi:spore germination protein KB